MANREALEFAGDRVFDHEAHSGESALLFALSWPEKGVACPMLIERSLFCKAYFAEGSDVDVQLS